MAEKRMFSKKITSSDPFLDMPFSAQALYFHLNLNADDEGFVNSPKRITREVRACEDDLRLLLAKKFIIAFESGIIVIKHWRMHNVIRKDRLTPTDYQEEKGLLHIKGNKSYSLRQPDDNQMSTTLQPDVSIEENRLEEISIDKINKEKIYKKEKTADKQPKKHKYGTYKNVLLTDEQLEKLKAKYPDWDKKIENLDNGIELKGYKYKNHYLAVIKWAERDKPKAEKKFANEREYSKEQLNEMFDDINSLEV